MKFYKTVISLEILSEEPVENCSLSDIDYEITHGQWSGAYKVLSVEKLTKDQVQNELKAQKSDPDFFYYDK